MAMPALLSFSPPRIRVFTPHEELQIYAAQDLKPEVERFGFPNWPNQFIETIRCLRGACCCGYPNGSPLITLAGQRVLIAAQRQIFRAVIVHELEFHSHVSPHLDIEYQSDGLIFEVPSPLSWPEVLSWEQSLLRDPGAAPIYADWCAEHCWAEREKALRAMG